MVGVAGGGVEELAVGGEIAVVEDEGDFVPAGGQVKGIFEGIAEPEHAEEAGVVVEAVYAHGVVVVPEGGGVLLEWVDVLDGFAGGVPVFGVAVVFGGDAGAVDMDDGADVGHAGATAMQGVVDGEEMLGGEVVDPLDVGGDVSAGFDEGAEGVGAVAPHAGGGDVAMDFGVDFAHGDADGAGAGFEESGGDRQGVDEGRKLEGVEHGDRFAGGGGSGGSLELQGFGGGGEQAEELRPGGGRCGGSRTTVGSVLGGNVRPFVAARASG